MAHIRCDFRSEVLDMGTSMTVILPESKRAEDVPVVYLLHGLADNCSGWGRYTSVERYARRYDIALIIPEVQRSFYADMELGLNYFKFVHDELPLICNRLFNISNSPDMTYVMGLSMGGYGALKCALTTPERYSGCGAFSAVTDIVNTVLLAKDGRPCEYNAIFGENVPNNADLNYLIENVNIEHLPLFYLSCGENDIRFSQSQHFSTYLKNKGIDCKFESFEGDHNWDFWDPAIERCLKFFFGGK